MGTIGSLITMLRRNGIDIRLTAAGRVSYHGSQPTPELVRMIAENCAEIGQVLTLEGRLNLGWSRCELQKNSAKAANLDTFWMGLLGEYEQACGRPALSAWEVRAA